MRLHKRSKVCSQRKSRKFSSRTSRGIAAVYADRLAKRGHDLILVTRSEKPLKALAASLSSASGRQITPIVADLNNETGFAKVETKLKDDPGVTMLVNNAGFASVAPLVDADIQKLEDMIALNVTTLTRLRVRNASLSLLLAQKFLPIFRWAGSTHLTEHTREVLLRFEAASHGDIHGNGQWLIE